MAECRVGPGGPAYRTPPESFKRISQEAYDYLLALHRQVFGLAPGTGTLDDTNVDASTIKNISHPNLLNVLPYQHHGAGAHDELDQGAAVADVAALAASATASTVAIAAADPGGTYTAAEQALLLELKQDLAQLVSDYNASVSDLNTTIAAVVASGTTLNALLAALRAAKLIA
jgi:hypothetical protein